MQTDDLIRALVADNANTQQPIGRTMALAVLAGIAGTAAAFSLTLDMRSDFLTLITHSPRFLFKFLFTLSVAIPAFVIARRYTRPEESSTSLTMALAIPGLLLLCGVMVEMAMVPSGQWRAFAMGHNAMPCLAMIPLLSLAPLGAILYALRQGAPSRPGLAGAAAGLLAAGIGATFYASHCADDSPFFLSIWYLAGISIVTGLGALAGRFLLKW